MVTHWLGFFEKDNLNMCNLKRDEGSSNMEVSLRAQKARNIIIGVCG